MYKVCLTTAKQTVLLPVRENTCGVLNRSRKCTAKYSGNINRVYISHRVHFSYGFHIIHSVHISHTFCIIHRVHINYSVHIIHRANTGH